MEEEKIELKYNIRELKLERKGKVKVISTLTNTINKLNLQIVKQYYIAIQTATAVNTSLSSDNPVGHITNVYVMNI